MAVMAYQLDSQPQIEAGVVFTKPWVVELMLDMAGYTLDKPLATLVVVEPSAGEGAFLLGMIRRLVTSCRQHGMPMMEAMHAIRAYEINTASALIATKAAYNQLIELDISSSEASALSCSWVINEDFLETALGFPTADFVVGNPPYIRLEEIPKKKAEMYRNAYDTMKGRADIYIAFYQASLSMLKPRGTCAFICANRWFLNDYGRGLRQFITSAFSVRIILETQLVDAFDDEVSAYPAITIISHDKQGSVVVGKALPGIEKTETEYVMSHLKSGLSNNVVQVARFKKWFNGKEPWPSSSPSSLLCLNKLEEKFSTLESKKTGTVVGIGVATGADKIFITSKPPAIEKERLLPLAMASDLKCGKIEWSGHYLVNPWNESGIIDLREYPLTKFYLEEHQNQLTKRHTAKNRPASWHRTIDRVNLSLFSKPKLYIADIKEKLIPCLDMGGTYPHHNLYYISSETWDLKVLGGLLMSKVAEFFIQCYSVKMRGGYYRFQAQYLRRIRVPDPDTISQKDRADLIRAFETQDKDLADKVSFKLYEIKEIPIAD